MFVSIVILIQENRILAIREWGISADSDKVDIDPDDPLLFVHPDYRMPL